MASMAAARSAGTSTTGSALAEILASKQVAGLVSDQHTVMTAVHAFTVEHTEPVIRTDGDEATPAEAEACHWSRFTSLVSGVVT